MSNKALLDILSNGKDPAKIMHYLGACYDGIKSLTFLDNAPDTASAMVSKDGEIVKFPEHFQIGGEVEVWLNDLTDIMKATLKSVLSRALEDAAHWDLDRPRHKWLFKFPAQVALLASQIYWTVEGTTALEELESGQEDAVKQFANVCTSRLEDLIKLVQGDLEKAERKKIITLITVDVHGRDVIQRLHDEGAEDVESFLWQSQLRYSWDSASQATDIAICDYATKYSYEYCGNAGRLVITPLTDRCYITLTMALKLMMGGAPAGPAGTGKTETTKDLARALGLPCYVFNCSDQMNYQVTAQIFQGLSQTGAWGCFDEFNRIPIEVLSVVATQVKIILDAIRRFAVSANRESPYNEAPEGTPPCCVGEFDFMGSRIKLIPTTGFFITMNPGYAGRQELPENLKSQFRSCAMIKPDLAPIAQNMLMAEGFVDARVLSIKFVTLYRISSELLSQQPHYDWGLRNVKSLLRVAGTLKRATPDVDEAAIIARALRDFNISKMPSKDIPIFLRLIKNIFPEIDLEVAQLDPGLKEQVEMACTESGLQPGSGFLAKVESLKDLLEVRHSVMLLGPAGSGKSSVWQTLLACHNTKREADCGC